VETSFVCLAGVAPGTCGPDNSVVALSAQENRTTLPYAQLPKVMIRALVAAEDRDFFHHNGIDPFGIARALYRDLTNSSAARQGGSTITQQYVKKTYLTSERTLTRKLKEAALAVKLERKYTKQQILERYLNEVYFGRGAYGVEAAARAYFDIPSRDLTVDQAALLVALIRAPLDDPSTHPDVSLRRRDGVIDAMVQADYLSPAEAHRAKATPIGATLVAKPARSNNVRVAPDFAAVGGEYIAEWVRRQLGSRFGEGAAYTKGLRVYLTIDPTDQRNAHDAIARNLDRPTDPASSLVSIDQDGRIVALVGGEDYATSQVNYALGRAGGGSGRAAGSTFKAFALAAFVEQGNSVKSVFPAPPELVLPHADQGRDWPVTNFEHEDLGTVTVEAATWHSANTVYAQIMQKVGAKAVAEMATRLGVSAPVNPVNSVVLGTSDVSVLDMATAYSTLADHGVRTTPYVIQRVESPSGKVLFDAGAPARSQVLSADVADTVTNVLRGVISKGTGTKALLKRVAAGKTGTTNDSKDAWFVGYTCHLTTAVWVGYDTPTPMLGVHGIPAVTGGTFPANIWRSYMSRATANEPRCTYRNIDAGKNKVNPELVAGPPTTTTLPPPTTTTVPGATTTTAPGATTTTVAAAPPAG
jgi:penicillin-binding protein 1A